MITESKFLTPLIVEEIDDGTWQIHEEFKYQSALLCGTITVPKDFKTDFASVPRIPFIFDVLGDIAHEPAVIHDWLYFLGQWYISRKRADLILLEAMTVNGVSWFKRWQIYIGVRIGGWYAWNEHAKNRIAQLKGGV